MALPWGKNCGGCRASILTWKAWKAKYPDGEVLSTETGHHRDYAGKAYAEYFAREETMFPVPKMHTEFPNKTWVLGVIVGGKAKAYPVDRLPDGHAVKDTQAAMRSPSLFTTPNAVQMCATLPVLRCHQ